MDSELSRVVTYVGADGRNLRWQAKTEDGAAYDLSSIRDNGSATISARLGDGGSTDDWLIKASAVTIEAGADGVAGWHNYTPTAAELPTAGEYIAQVRLVDVSSRVDYLGEVIIEVREPVHQEA